MARELREEDEADYKHNESMHYAKKRDDESGTVGRT